MKSTQRWIISLVLIALAAAAAGIVAFLLQSNRNRVDANERFDSLARRVTHGIVERIRRYEYGLRGARGIVVAMDGAATREAFARYSESRNIDVEFPGARGFGIVMRVREGDEASFIAARRAGGAPDFTIKTLSPHGGDRYVISFVEPVERNREAIGLDIASEAARREAADQAARTSNATLSAPLTLVQAAGKTSGGLLLLMPIRRSGANEATTDHPQSGVIGWSYVPLLISDILSGLDAEENHFALSLHDIEHHPLEAFHATGKGYALADELEEQRIPIPLYGRHWEARLQPTEAFLQSLHQPSPLHEALKAMLLGGFCAALLITGVQLVERTRAQRLELARRAAIVEGSSDAVIVQTLDGIITDWNDGAARLFGFSREEAHGRTATDLLVPPELAEEDERLRATVAAGQRVHVFETTRRAQDGTTIPVSITASPIHDDDGVVVGSAKIVRDVREAKIAERRMRDLNASLEDQVRERTALLDEAMHEAREANEAKSRFLANISHEIRTPMNAVIGLSHMLERTTLDDDQAGMLNRIRVAGKTLMALLNDVLDLSKIEAGEMTLEASPFYLADVIEEVSSIASVAADQRGISFSVTMNNAYPGQIVGDSMRVSQILLNLVSNAVKFTAKGGVSLDIRTAAIDNAGRLPIVFKVIDTGIGIAEDARKRLFQPFVQADTSTTRRFGGTGLGLSIVRQLVELIGGSISLQSEAGKGSTFEVTLALPYVDQTGALTKPPVTVPAPLASLAGVRVLVVDDNALNREVAERILNGEGALVWLAKDGEEAVELLRLSDAGFQAILMDVQMPIMDGLEAARRIRALPHGTSLPVIGLTAGVSSEERRAALEAGMDTVIGKPFEPLQLIKTVSRLLSTDDEIFQPNDHRNEATTLPANWPVIEGLDHTAAFRRLKGDIDLYRRMLTSLQAMAEVNARLAAEPLPRPSILRQHVAMLHDLKGLAGTVGADGLLASASLAERLLLAQDWQSGFDAMRTLEAQSRPVMDAISQSLATSASFVSDPVPQRSVPFLSPSELTLLLTQVKNRDFAALSTWKNLSQWLYEVLGAQSASELGEQIESLQFQDAEQRLEDLVRVHASS